VLCGWGKDGGEDFGADGGEEIWGSEELDEDPGRDGNCVAVNSVELLSWGREYGKGRGDIIP
jgi:hypothetical protein